MIVLYCIVLYCIVLFDTADSLILSFDIFNLVHKCKVYFKIKYN